MEAKRSRGRPPFVPTDRDRKQVRMLAAMGLMVEEIARVIGVTDKTLQKHFEDELAVGPSEATANVAQALYKQAVDPLKPNVTAAIFWLKARAGWRDNDFGNIDKPGKKQERHAAAEKTAKGRFAPKAPPKLVAVR